MPVRRARKPSVRWRSAEHLRKINEKIDKLEKVWAAEAPITLQELERPFFELLDLDPIKAFEYSEWFLSTWRRKLEATADQPDSDAKELKKIERKFERFCRACVRVDPRGRPSSNVVLGEWVQEERFWKHFHRTHKRLRREIRRDFILIEELLKEYKEWPLVPERNPENPSEPIIRRLRPPSLAHQKGMEKEDVEIAVDNAPGGAAALRDHFFGQYIGSEDPAQLMRRARKVMEKTDPDYIKFLKRIDFQK